MELTLVRTGKETVFAELPKYFLHLISMSDNVVRVNENIVKVYNYAHIEQIREDIIHEVLEGGRCIGEAERHDIPFKQTIAGPEGCLPFVTFSDTDKVIGMAEIDLGVDAGFAGSIQEIGDERKGISVLLGDAVETSEVNTEMERAILFLTKRTGVL